MAGASGLSASNSGILGSKLRRETPENRRKKGVGLDKWVKVKFRPSYLVYFTAAPVLKQAHLKIKKVISF